MSRTLNPDIKSGPKVPKTAFALAVDDLKNVLSGIPDQPKLKLMTFDELKTKVSKGKGPSKRSNTYRAIGEKLDAAQATLRTATLDGVTKVGGPTAFQKQFETQLNELNTAIAAYQKHHKGKKADAVAPLLNDIKVLRAEMSGVLADLGNAKEKGFQDGASIEAISDFRTIDDALAKAIGTSFKTKTLADLTQEGGRAAIERQIVQELDTLASSIGTTRPGGNASPDLLAGIQRTKEGLPVALDRLAQMQAKEKPAATFPADMNIAAAAAALQAGIRPEQLKGVCGRFCNFADFNRETEIPPKSGAGSGACNEVFKINYADGPRIFKEERTSDKNHLTRAPGAIGIDKLNDPRYGNRNVASGLVGELLGTGVIVKSSFAITGGQGNEPGEVGVLMERAGGRDLKVALDFKDTQEHKYADERELLAAMERQELLPWKGKLSPKALASLQRQLMDLEACDVLCGQVDRHCGNYLIDVQGDNVTVKGIDNDFAFGSQNPGGIPPDDTSSFNNIANMPRLISQQMADKIQSLDFDRDVGPQFAGLLADGEIQAARQRFVALQNHVAGLARTGCVVADWETWRGPNDETASEYLNVQGQDSMFKRDVLPYVELLESVAT